MLEPLVSRINKHKHFIDENTKKIKYSNFVRKPSYNDSHSRTVELAFDTPLQIRKRVRGHFRIRNL